MNRTGYMTDFSTPEPPTPIASARRRKTNQARGKYAEQAAEARLNRLYHDYFVDLCNGYDFTVGDLPAWKGTLSTWRRREVPWEVIEDAFDTMVTARERKGTLTTTDQQFRYFCGIVWRIVKASEEDQEAQA